MILLAKRGDYLLFETSDQTKILTLDGKISFAWITAGKIGEILVPSKKKFIPKKIISSGGYRIYHVKKEPKLTDLDHLELFVGNGMWQGYLLPTGLPEKNDKNRIITTNEIITKSTH